MPEPRYPRGSQKQAQNKPKSPPNNPIPTYKESGKIEPKNGIKVPKQKPKKRSIKTDSMDKESRKEKRNEAPRKRKKKLH
jgi:hypothetical protein